MATVHGTCIEVDGVGVLLRGPSGSGKSDLALRLIDSGALLVSDDQVVVENSAGRLLASAPETIAGLLEVRGVGLMTMPSAAESPLGLVVDLAPAGHVPRLPEPATVDLEGTSLPMLRLDPFEVSAPAKLRLSVRALSQDIRRG